MPTLRLAAARTAPKAADLVAHAVTSDALDDLPGGIERALADSLGFAGETGQVAVVAGGERPLALVGLGAPDAVDAAAVRSAAAALVRTAGSFAHLAYEGLEVPGDLTPAEVARSITEAVLGASYRYDEYKSAADPARLARVTLVGPGGKKTLDAAIAEGTVLAEAVALARDLVNEPGGSLTPVVFARKASQLARAKGLKVKVLDKAAIKRAKLGGLLGVNRGSDNDPRFVELTYEPAGTARGTLAFVGKGITFDAGGLSIKTGQGMQTMKMDMGGGAAVIASMGAIADLAPPVRVRAYVPMTDNMLGGDATRPGDVLTIRNGKTIEVLNTDAEGRLILADALSMASEAAPDAIVDLATLTGACIVALGQKIAGLMGNDDEFVTTVREAAERAGERVWHLPLPDDYRKQLESPVADMKNIGTAYGGALTAGLLLSEFVGEGIPWVHLDIAGPAWVDSADGESSAGGTGFGVRTLVELARSFEPPARG